MKCPKCHYLSFEPSPRCRNCGFDLGIADVEMAIRPAEEPGVPGTPAADLELQPKRRTAPRRAPKTIGLIHPARDAEAPGTSAPVFEEVPLRIELDPPAAAVPQFASTAAPQFPSSRTSPVPQPQTPGELPLFVKGLLSGPSRPPLSVRRAAPELVRPKPPASVPTPPRPPGPFDADLMEDLRRMETEEKIRPRVEAREPRPVEAVHAGEVGRMTRLAALGADWAILAALSTVILWASLRVADARVQDLTIQAIVPLGAFLILVGITYFVMFTLGNGQTPGKMALHIRVIDATVPDAQPPSLMQALNRTLLPDRFTQTRTVRA